ncbi:MAG: RhuM family protein [Thermodesulfobacteriota bacterium]|nr:RhuM family protein [Thermodesulfobacteriota bacterium]
MNNSTENPQQNIIIYNTADGKTSVSLYTQDGMIWMNQKQLAELFATSKQNIGQHITSILNDKELEQKSVVKNYFTTAADGKEYNVTFYALEMILDRADADQPNMALTAFKGNVIRKQDIFIAKNYLNEDEIDTLNRLVTIFLETAELRVKSRTDITLKFWRENVDKILSFNEQPVLSGKGKVSHKQMERKVREIYRLFDKKRKIFAAQQADADDLQSLKQLEQEIKREKD